VVLADGRLHAELVTLGIRPSSSCFGSHPFQEEFLSAPIHSLPLCSPIRSFNWYQSRFGSLLTPASLRSKDVIPEMGFGSSALQWEELLDVAELDGGIPPWKGLDPLGSYGEHNLCSSD
jgi:hypothetical protein